MKKKSQTVLLLVFGFAVGLFGGDAALAQECDPGTIGNCTDLTIDYDSCVAGCTQCGHCCHHFWYQCYAPSVRHYTVNVCEDNCSPTWNT